MVLFHRYAQLFLSWFLIVESIPEHWGNIEKIHDLRHAHGTTQLLRMMEESTKNTKTKQTRGMLRKKKKKKQQAQEEDGDFLSSTINDQPLEYENISTNDEEDEKVKIHFNYNPLSPRGPPQWDKVDVHGSDYFDHIAPADGEDLNECGKRQQSPVNLIPMKECNDDHQIRTLRGRPDFDTIRFEILPHALRANLHIPEDHEQAARADFSNLSDWVYAKHVDIKIRSEHYLNGKQYKAEFQITHFWDDDDGKFIVLSILMDDSSDQHNIQLEEFIREWEELAWERKYKCQHQEQQQQQQQQQQQITQSSISKNQNKINTTVSYNNYTRSHPLRTKEDMIRIWGSDKGVPGQSNWDIYKFLTTSWYCGYHGSLTVPPCSQIVHWRILDYPMSMSKHQFKRLRKLLFRQRDDNCRYSTVGWKGFANRPIQFNYHRVWCCTRDDWKPRDPWVNYTFPAEYKSFRKSVAATTTTSLSSP